MRVLLVEDSEEDSLMTLHELWCAGYEVVHERVQTEASLTEALQRQGWDLILADYTMPRLRGTTALRIVKEHGLDVPFIFVSGRMGEDAAVASMKAGAHDYIVKGHLGRLVPAVQRELNEAEQRRAHQQTSHMHSQLETIVNAVPELAATIDSRGRISYLNSAGRRMLDLDESADTQHLCIFDYYMDWAADSLREEGIPCAIRDGVWQRQLALRTSRGREVTVSQTVLCHGGEGEADGVVTLIAADISDRQNSEQHLFYLAQFDTLTNLPNRSLFRDRLSLELPKAVRDERQVAVILVGLDCFKLINNGMGHWAGDAMLQHVAHKIQGCLRKSDAVARMSGDEFAVLVEDVPEPGAMHALAQKILDSVSLPLIIDNKPVAVTASIGITLAPRDSDDLDGVFRNADLALSNAKLCGRNNYQWYAPELNDAILGRLTREIRLRNALRDQELLLHYQPLVALDDGRLKGMEALLRWQDAEMGMIYPAQFVPLAEESGLMLPIGEWVLRTACTQNKSWQDMGFPPIRITVNVSRRQIRQGGFAGLVKRVLQETGLEARYLDLDITENVVMNGDVETLDALNELHAIGVSLSVDDFGGGYSDMQFLKRVPVQRLKIDRALVNEFAVNRHGEGGLSTDIVAIAKSLDLEVTAKGVETAEQQRCLLDQHCRHAQGYFCGRPLPAQESTRWLAETHRWLSVVAH
ncbi:MAG: putative bifunctional diguanylate cyclase/phosphodiesterase [Burkholderiales bacterium]